MTRLVFGSAAALLTAALFATGSGLAQERTETLEPSQNGSGQSEPMAGCTEMMKAAGVTDEGKSAMREFMRSDGGRQAMTNMMEMARRMGNGDAMLGMTRMMKMMGSMGGGSMGGHDGMMRGQGGMTTPGGQPPSK